METSIYIETETLSDGSEVFNVIIDDGYGNRIRLESETEKAAADLAMAIEVGAMGAKVVSYIRK